MPTSATAAPTMKTTRPAGSFRLMRVSSLEVGAMATLAVVAVVAVVAMVAAVAAVASVVLLVVVLLLLCTCT